jgi:tetratricopeptide (TPR) repeat protein
MKNDFHSVVILGSSMLGLGVLGMEVPLPLPSAFEVHVCSGPPYRCLPPEDRANWLRADRAQERGWEALKKGDFRTAEKSFKAAYAAYPVGFPSLRGLAEVYDRSGRKALAWTVYRRAFDSDALHDVAGLTRYGDLALAAGRRERAWRAYERAAFSTPPDLYLEAPRARSFACVRGAAYARLGMDAFRHDDMRQARRWLTASVRADGNAWMTRFYLGRVLNTLGRPREALAQLSRAERLAEGRRKALVLTEVREIRAAKGM